MDFFLVVGGWGGGGGLNEFFCRTRLRVSEI